MTDVRVVMFLVGAASLCLFAVGSRMSAIPRIDMPLPEVRTLLTGERPRVLYGTMLAMAGAAMLLWPLAAVPVGLDEKWHGLGAFSVAVWVMGFTVLSVPALFVAALLWREPYEVPDTTFRLVLDAAHLSTWSLSAPLGGIATVATTVVGIMSSAFPWGMAVLAALKVGTVIVEVIGTERRTGWNAGGWAAGASGYATVVWMSGMLLALLLRPLWKRSARGPISARRARRGAWR